MKDKRQRVAFAWPYGLTSDPAFYAYLVNAAATAASLSQHSYAPHPNHQQSPPFNFPAASTAVQRAGCSFSPAPASHLAAQFSFPVGLAAAAAAAAAVARLPGGIQSTSSNQPEVAAPSVTSPDLVPAFLPYRSRSLGVAVTQSTEQRGLFQPYKTDSDRSLWRHRAPVCRTCRQHSAVLHIHVCCRRQQIVVSRDIVYIIYRRVVHNLNLSLAMFICREGRTHVRVWLYLETLPYS